MSFTITSPAFQNAHDMPMDYTSDGSDQSPPLNWSGVPVGTQSLALIVQDPDAPDPQAPKRIFVHWLLYNIPPETSGLPTGVSTEDLPPGTLEGKNDFGRGTYGGPSPPIGRHRYFFKLFALDVKLPDLNKPTRTDLERAMEGHILAQTELMGLYQKPR
jgi:Raf kinase inhibitor-like YbhB/YbcL family protein